jgi:lysophospholipase L1-like esterase
MLQSFRGIRGAVGFLAGALLAVASGCSSTGSSGVMHVDIGTNNPNLGVAFGDSISHGRDSLVGSRYLDDAGPDEPGYRRKLEELFAAEGRVIHMIEDGEPGTESPAGAARVGEAIATRPAFLVLLYGTNDALRLRPAMDLIANLRFIAEECRRNHIIVVLCTIPPVCAPATHEVKIVEYNSLIVPLAKELDELWQGVVLADLHAAFEAHEGGGCALVNPTKGVHPTRAGYELIAATIYEALSGLAW